MMIKAAVVCERGRNPLALFECRTTRFFRSACGLRDGCSVANNSAMTGAGPDAAVVVIAGDCAAALTGWSYSERSLATRAAASPIGGGMSGLPRCSLARSFVIGAILHRRQFLAGEVSKVIR